MARPKKQTVDYFPHFVTSGKTLYILESSFGNNGYAFWFKLLELLGTADGHVYDCRNTPSWRFLLAKTQVDEVTANNILNTLVELEAIDKELWENRLIWSDNFVQNLLPVYNNRKSSLPKKPVIEGSNDNMGEFLPVETPVIEVSTPKNPQSKVKESKVKDSKVNNNNKDVDDDDNKNIFKVLEHCGFGMVNPYLAEKLSDLEEEYSFEWTKEAIEIAATNGVKNLGYIKTILNTWKTKGKDYKPPKQQYGKKDNFNNFESRNYSKDQIDDLERKLLGLDKEDPEC